MTIMLLTCLLLPNISDFIQTLVPLSLPSRSQVYATVANDGAHFYYNKKLLSYLLICDDGSAVSVMAEKYAMTYRHGNHMSLVPFKSVLVVRPFPLSEWPLPDGRDLVRLGVIYVDDDVDFVLLEALEGGRLCDGNPPHHQAYTGKECVLAGFSSSDRHKSPLAMQKGVISSGKLDARKHIAAAFPSRPGDSGGILASVGGGILGMQVSCDTASFGWAELRDPMKTNAVLDRPMTKRGEMIFHDSRFGARCHVVPSYYIQGCLDVILTQKNVGVFDTVAPATQAAKDPNSRSAAGDGADHQSMETYQRGLAERYERTAAIARADISWQESQRAEAQSKADRHAQLKAAAEKRAESSETMAATARAAEQLAAAKRMIKEAELQEQALNKAEWLNLHKELGNGGIDEGNEH